MLTPLLVALSLAVPYLPQTEDLCGGAAAAMVLRYWGDTHASVDDFAPLVDRRAGGIVDDVLARALADRGWSATTFVGSLERLDTEVGLRHPVIILIASGRSRFHYVVVTGIDRSAMPARVVVHDPTWGPARRLAANDLLQAWSASGFWSLLILPTEQSRRATADERARQAADADEPVPEPGSLGAAAGRRFADHEWQAAAALATQAVQQNPGDRYAWDVLGSSWFMQDDQVGALEAWNHIQKPRIDFVQIENLQRTRYRTISDALGLTPNTLLTVDGFRLAERRLDELPDRAASRLTYSPEPDGFATVDVAMVERSWRPAGAAEWIAKGLSAVVDREATADLPGPSGEGALLSARWRWWTNRPAVSLSFAAPRFGANGGIWRVDAGWDTQAYAIGPADDVRFTQDHRHAGLTVSNWISANVRFSASAGVEAWTNPTFVRAAFVGGSLERRWPNDRWSVGGEMTWWLAGDVSDFGRGAVRLGYRSSTASTGWVYTADAGLEHATAAAPLGLWPGAGEGHVSDLLLRAHPLLQDGVIRLNEQTIFARTVAFGTARAERWLNQSAPLRLAIAGFADVAGAAAGATPVDVLTSGSMARLQVDVGAGVRVRIPGTAGALRVDYAHGMRDGANAVTAGWDF